MARQIDTDAGKLYDYAVEQPDGFTRYDVERDLGWRNVYLYKVARRVRLILAADEINLVCDPQGSGEPWLYRLVGNYEDAGPWQANRIGDMCSRLETVHSVAGSVVASSDGRTVEGRKARKIERTIGFLLAELDEIAETQEAAA